MVPSHRNQRPNRRASVGALAAAAFVLAAPVAANAGLLDFLFGGSEQPAPPPGVNSYAEPPAPLTPRLPESVRQGSGGGGRYVAFCVRLCDGQHFPLDHVTAATPIETCRAMCPASRTKVFFGSQIDHAVAGDGAHYADLEAAFVYRQHLVANCTCNGKDAFGLARFELTTDPTLRPGDIVATKTGFVAYAGRRGAQSAEFTPVDPATVEAELSGGSTRVRLTRRSKEGTAVEEARGSIVPPDDGQQANIGGQAER